MSMPGGFPAISAASPWLPVALCRALRRKWSERRREQDGFSRRKATEANQALVLDLNELVTSLDKMLRRVIGEDIELATITVPNLGRIRADPGRIEQVLMNLVVNACDAMEGGGKLTIETANVELGADYAVMHPEVEAGAYVMLSVSDTGGGMDAKTIAKIFEPFFTTKLPGKGTDPDVNFLAKPYLPEDLARCVREALDKVG
jgi:signal transduction histidine kinase